MTGHKTKVTGSTTGSAALDACPGDLGTAIVHRACVDYLMVLRGRKTHSRDRLETRDEIEQFFRGRWFSVLCGADGDAILAALRRMNSAGIKTIYFTNDREEQ